MSVPDGASLPPQEGPRAGPEASVPDVIGLPLGEALKRLGGVVYTLALTAPPRPKGERGAVRVVARRLDGGRLKLICAREYYDRPGSPGGPEAEAEGEGEGDAHG